MHATRAELIECLKTVIAKTIALYNLLFVYRSKFPLKHAVIWMKQQSGIEVSRGLQERS